MSTPDPKLSGTDSKGILESNPQLDRERIAEMAAFQKRMEDAGYKVRSDYRVTPALGSVHR
ncbi:MAG: hypothetical protein Q6370_010590 [Candidatus Sigynarchaeota archaeon]